MTKDKKPDHQQARLKNANAETIIDDVVRKQSEQAKKKNNEQQSRS